MKNVITYSEFSKLFKLYEANDYKFVKEISKYGLILEPKLVTYYTFYKHNDEKKTLTEVGNDRHQTLCQILMNAGIEFDFSEITENVDGGKNG